RIHAALRGGGRGGSAPAALTSTANARRRATGSSECERCRRDERERARNADTRNASPRRGVCEARREAQDRAAEPEDADHPDRDDGGDGNPPPAPVPAH